MEKEKKYNGFVIFLFTIVFILIVLCIIFATGVVEFKTRNSNNNYKADESTDITENNDKNIENESKAEELEDSISVNIKYSGDYVDLMKYIMDFDGDSQSDGKLLNLLISDVYLNDEKHVFRYVNHPQNCLSLLSSNTYGDNYNNTFIDEHQIGHQGNQACYLSAYKLLTIINYKYLGLVSSSQSGEYMSVFDKNGYLVDYLSDVIDINVKDKKIEYSDYVEENGCLVNYYSYSINEGKPIKTFIRQEENNVCNPMNGKGCCNY